MIKRFLHGIVFGAGFGLAFVAIWTVWYYWLFPSIYSEGWISERSAQSSGSPSSGEPQVATPPTIVEKQRFLGSTGIYSGDFERSGSLASGAALIAGKVTTDDGPVQGLKLRLALNGSVLSQWAKTDENGLYKVSVPPGQYRIDGYELDHETANSALGGKIGSPKNPHQTGKFEVSDAVPGEGLDFHFVEPIVKTGPNGDVKLDEDLEITWQPYPGAISYSVQIYESDSKRDMFSRKSLYSWRTRPKVEEPRLRISDHGVELKKDHYYFVEIVAFDGGGRNISRTPHERNEKDFHVTE